MSCRDKIIIEKKYLAKKSGRHDDFMTCCEMDDGCRHRIGKFKLTPLVDFHFHFRVRFTPVQLNPSFFSPNYQITTYPTTPPSWILENDPPKATHRSNKFSPSRQRGSIRFVWHRLLGILILLKILNLMSPGCVCVYLQTPMDKGEALNPSCRQLKSRTSFSLWSLLKW